MQGIGHLVGLMLEELIERAVIVKVRHAAAHMIIHRVLCAVRSGMIL